MKSDTANERIIRKIIRELKKIAFADFSKAAKALNTEENSDFFLKLAELEGYFPFIAQVKAVKGGVEIKFHDKLKALEMLSKHVKQQDGREEGDFDNLITILRGRASDIWKEEDNH